MNNNTTFANREVCDLIFVEYKSRKPFLNLDFANTTTTEMSGEVVYAYGGEGRPKRVTFHGERGGTIAFETQMKTAKLYSLITGASIDTAAKFLKREVVKCGTAGKLTVSGTPVVGTVNVFKADDDCGTELTATATASSKEITVTDATANDSYIVYYMTELTEKVRKINIKSTTFRERSLFMVILTRKPRTTRLFLTEWLRTSALPRPTSLCRVLTAATPLLSLSPATLWQTVTTTFLILFGRMRRSNQYG